MEATQAAPAAPESHVDISSMTDAQLDAALQTEGGAPDAPEPPAGTDQAADGQAPAGDQDGAQGTDPNRQVPYGALHEERQRRRNLERQQEADRQAFAEAITQLRGQAKTMAERLQKYETPPAPDLNNDPLGALVYQNQTLTQTVQQLAERIDARDRNEQQSENSRRVVNLVESHEAAFRQSTPDYDDAINHAKTARMRQYMAIGLSEDQAFARVQNDAQQIVIHALQSRQNPAEAAYRFAQASGWVSPRAKQEMQRAGQAAAKPSGSNSRGGISLEALAAMSDADFDKIAGDKTAWKKLMGG